MDLFRVILGCMNTTPNDETARNNYLATIRNSECRRYELEWHIRTLVKAALREGATWREIGEALGVSGQAAWEKHRDVTMRTILTDAPRQRIKD